MEVLSFAWSDVCPNKKHLDTKEDAYPLPNFVRNDGSPWYFDSGQSEVVYYTGIGSNVGAAFFAKQPIQDGDEVLLDYALLPPLPSWARGGMNEKHIK